MHSLLVCPQTRQFSSLIGFSFSFLFLFSLSLKKKKNFPPLWCSPLLSEFPSFPPQPINTCESWFLVNWWVRERLILAPEDPALGK